MARPKKQYVSVNSLSPQDKKRLLGAVQEWSDSQARIDVEKELMKSIVDDISEAVGVDKKLIRKMAVVYHNANFHDEVEEHRTFEEFYDLVVNGKTSDADRLNQLVSDLKESTDKLESIENEVKGENPEEPQQ